MNHTNYGIIASFLSSSELNRCKKNGLKWYETQSIKEWHTHFSAGWMPRKLRRKLRHLYHCNILPVKIAAWAPIIDVGDGLFWPICESSLVEKGIPPSSPLYLSFKEFHEQLAKQLLASEDEAIMKGPGK